MKPYVPETLPLESLKWEEFISLIGKANFELARYEGVLQGIISPSVFLSPLTTQEAVLSSKIEGTEATLEEVLEYEASPRPDAKRLEDIQEIINYRKSTDYAMEWLKTHPITLNLLREIHYMLLDSVRGRNKTRGEFRKTQTWIGKAGATIEQASYIPPSPERLMEYLSNLEKYVHCEEKDRLVQLAIIHAQFEIIHPFLDGNGRIGRILIPLFLFEKKLLSSPMFYISAYLEARRQEYYAKLRAVTEENDWSGWIQFFLTGIIEQSKANTKKAKTILSLYDRMKMEIPKFTYSHAIQALDALFTRPIFNSKDFIKGADIPKRSANRILEKLNEQNIIKIIKEGKGTRPPVFIFSELIEIVG